MGCEKPTIARALAVAAVAAAMVGIGSEGWFARPAGAQGTEALVFSDTVGAGTGLWLSHADGTGRRILVDDSAAPEAQPDWAPGCQHVAYAVQQGRPWVIRSVALGDLAVSNLTTGPEDFEPDWSPDGTRVLFTSYFNRNTPDQTSFVMTTGADGSGARPVIALLNPTYFIGNPRWSPDGMRVAFTVGSTRDGGELYVMNADGTGARRLLDHPGWDDIDPAWSPDGTRIAFASGRHLGTTEATRHDLWLLDVDLGLAGTILIDAERDLRRPAWSPDGERLALDTRAISGTRAVYNIHVVNASGGSLSPPIGTGWEVDWCGESALPTPTLTPPTPGATEPIEPTPTVGGSATAPPPPITPVPTLPTFPTLPTPGPTDPDPAPTFPAWTRTPTASPTASPTTTDTPTASPAASGTPTASPSPSESPTISPGRPVYLPLALDRAPAHTG